MQNHSDFARKLLMRSAIAGTLRPALVADCFAGEGVIAGALWAGIADNVLCIERNPDCAPTLHALAARHPGVEVVIADNAALTARIVAAEIIDADAYGMSLPFIERLMQFGLRTGTLVFFTDGTPMKQRRMRNATRVFSETARRLFSKHYVEAAQCGTAYYGYGWTC